MEQRTSSQDSATQAEPNLALNGSTRQYLTFVLGTELFAVSIARVCEVIELSSITEIPLSPPVVPGVINLRGSVVPVVDLARRLGRDDKRAGRRTCIVIVEIDFEDGLLPMGVLVDSVREAIEVDSHELEAAPAFGSGLRADFVSGMVNLAGSFVLVLDLSVVLRIRELELLIATAAGVAAEPS